MRRKERRIVSKEEIEGVIAKAEVLRVAFAVDNKPYIIPVNFGYSKNTFYFHCASEGQKLEMLRKNPQVGFELEGDIELIKGNKPCEFTMAYESVIGNGDASIIESDEEKIKGLNILMAQYTDSVDLNYDEKLLDRIVIVKINVKEMTGKKSK